MAFSPFGNSDHVVASVSFCRFCRFKMVNADLVEFFVGETSSLLSILKYQKPMIVWSKTGNRIRGSLPRFMREFGKGEFFTAFHFQILEANNSLE